MPANALVEREPNEKLVSFPVNLFRFDDSMVTEMEKQRKYEMFTMHKATKSVHSRLEVSIDINIFDADSKCGVDAIAS